MRHPFALVLPWLLVCAGELGCSCPTFSRASVEGVIQGRDFPAADALSTVFSGNNGNYAAIAITNACDTCAALAESISIKNGQTLQFFIADVDASDRSSAPVAPRTYPMAIVSKSSFASSIYLAHDEACRRNGDATSESGSITITSVGADGSYAGSFDVTYTGGVRLTGTFRTASCPRLIDHVGGRCTVCRTASEGGLPSRSPARTPHGTARSSV